jgi:hypothetical protein
MWLLRVKVNNPPFVKDGVYLFDDENVKKVPDKAADKYNYFNIKPITTQKNLLLIRSGGIGDLMAYSVLQHRAENVVFITQAKYRPYLKLWQKPPIFKAPSSPIFIAKTFESMVKQLEDYGRMTGEEDAIELGSRENWYNIINRAANQPNEHQRPQLIQPQGEQIKGCLIVSNSSVVDRTADNTAIVKACLPYFNHIILAHDQGWKDEEYINALMRYEYVISVDTSAIHIREGFGLPALGLYGAFEKDCRTLGHIYTQSIQINNCTPCHRHSRLPCQFNQGTKFAPCLSGEVMTKQIEEHLKQNYEYTNSKTMD